MFLGTLGRQRPLGREDHHQLDHRRLEHHDPALREHPRRLLRGQHRLGLGGQGRPASAVTQLGLPRTRTSSMFIASDNVCGGRPRHPRHRRLPGRPGPTSPPCLADHEPATPTASSWPTPTRAGNLENINSGLNLDLEGGSPLRLQPSPRRRQRRDVRRLGPVRHRHDQRAVWAKLLTPAGSQLPAVFRQMPLGQDDVLK